MIDEILELNKDCKAKFVDEELYSFSPPQSMFGYSYHAHMIPPFRPTTMLMMGYGFGAVPDLCRSIWGADLRITCIDDKRIDDKHFEYLSIYADAEQWIKDQCCSDFFKKHDYIAIDLWRDKKPCEFIFDKSFTDCLYKMCGNLVCVNTLESDFKRMKNFQESGFIFHRHVNVYGNVVTWWGK